MAADAGNDRVETGEHRSGGDQVRQQINAAVRRLAGGHRVVHETIRGRMRAV
jgi:hypothetical protein